MRRRLIARLPEVGVRALQEEWWWRAHEGQIEPGLDGEGADADWRIWAILAGRGFGKTRAGAEWVWARARAQADARIALVAATLDEAARVMVEGASGLLSIARRGEKARWLRGKGEVHFPSGAKAFVYSAGRADMLRGPQHHFAWADELAQWPQGDSAWDNLMLGLRLGERPRAVATTTPRPVPLLKRVLALPRCAVTRGRTDDNPHLPGDFRSAMRAAYGGTRLGRQELDGLLLEDVEGALWTREVIEGSRRSGTLPRMVRVVVGVDPPASAQGDACGIVVCGRDAEGRAWVLADLSVAGLRPEGWAGRVSAAAEVWGAQCVVAERNQGGDMVESVLKAAGCQVPVRLAFASLGKAARAEPVALRFEKGEAGLAGDFAELEAQMCGMTYAGYEGPGGSPDRADAMVWAMSELFRPRAEPRVRGF
jgi:phage terminase large subunit-like protein